ncbi:AAA family ATPase [Paenibacillus sp. P46E]|uniref:AAA family ATPase n=1 Tax=Paenibacillus sp. P46E TaxID=1349436 RepID=UPI00093F63E5|nr:AAA family ATPase [Paenibacillus sp. P46E]OKP97189.1 hypothetical protein A3849_17265 [Paenibacillus sp. P46E]
MPIEEGFKLAKIIEGTIMEISSFLYSAEALAKMVRTIHHQSRMIGRLNPSSVRLALDLREAFLIENGNADYAYLAPEQLGRMEYKPDERSDLYALGVIFYEMLAGRLPFQAEHREDWVHLHMAAIPGPLHEYRPELAGPLEDIIARLMSKSPEMRYQSAYGLLADIRQCVAAYEETGELLPFEIGLADRASRFRLPKLLYGRELEAKQLHAAYEQTCGGGSAFVLVTGRSGSGKTALIEELYISVLREGGRFVTGKCDPMNREMPYAPILQALRGLLQQVWSETPDRAAELGIQLRETMGQGAGVITEFLPDAAGLFGGVFQAEALPPVEAAVRFRRLLPMFIGAFASKERPLVLFLDDLQWADPDTLDFLYILAEDLAMHGLMVIGTFRSETIEERLNSLDGYPASAIWLDEVLSPKQQDRPLHIRHIQLEALIYEDVRQFLSQLLKENTSRIRQLAELVYHRTAGDPLYLHRLMDNLYREHKLYYDEEQAFWVWDTEAIAELPEAPGLLHFLEARIRQLPGDTIGLLGIAAALGHRFRVSAISAMSGYTVEDTLSLLRIAEAEGLINLEKDAEPGGTDDSVYTFLHDRVQEVVYSIIPVTEQAGLHLAIGRSMSKDMGGIAYSVFERVHHLNLGAVKMEDETERNGLAALNLHAGMKSKATTAFASALYFLETGLHLLGEEEAVPGSLAYRLLLELPECEYMCGYTERAAVRLERLLAATTELLERSRIYRIRIAMCAYLKKDEQAVQVGRQALAEWGWKLPVKPTSAAVITEVALTQKVLYQHRNVLKRLPVNREPHYIALSELVMSIASSAFTLSLSLAAVLFSRFVRFGLSRGNNEAFAYILAGYGLVLMRNKLSFAQTGAFYIEEAIQLASSFESVDLRCRLDYIMGLALLKHQPKEGLHHFRQSVKHGMEAANLPFVSIAMLTSVTNHTGGPAALSALITEYEGLAGKLVDTVTLNIFQISKAYVARLQGLAAEGDESPVPVHSSRSSKVLNNEVFYICTCQMEIAYLEGRFQDALAWAQEGSFNTFRQTRMQVRKQHVYQSLALAALYAESPPAKRRDIRSKLRKQWHGMRSWTGYFGQGYSAYLLIKAEMQHLNGNHTEAAKGYEQAIAAARQEKNGLLEGISCERASAFYRAAGTVTGADGLLQDACMAYLHWGAAAKVTQLGKAYPDLKLPAAGRTMEQLVVGAAIAPAERAVYSDNGKELFRQMSSSAERAVHSDWRDRLNSLLESALRYSGAVKGYIFGSREEEYIIVARSGSAENPQDRYAESVVRYVMRTGEPVLLTNASVSSYAADPYIMGNQSLSVLCLPVFFPGGVERSVVYLENHLMAGAFTDELQTLLDFMITRMVYQQALEDSRPAGPSTAGATGSEPQADRLIPGLSGEHPLDLLAAAQAEPLMEPLTLREHEILCSLSDGLSNKEIATRFGITEGTVKSHVFRLYGKLGAKRRAQAVARARELNLLN